MVVDVGEVVEQVVPAVLMQVSRPEVACQLNDVDPPAELVAVRLPLRS